MKRLLIAAALILATAVSRVGNANNLPQVQDDAVRVFEVASIKPSGPGAAAGPRYSLRGRVFVSVNASLRDLIKFAYGVHASQIIGAPAWIESDRYDIEAVPDGEGMPNDRQMKAMLRNLLADRFQLVFHREQREVPAFVIVPGTGKPRLTPTRADPGSMPVAAIGPGGFTGVNATIDDFAAAMQGVAMDRPVVDETGLAGRWDFTLEWTPDPSQFGGTALPVGRERDRPPALFTAIQEQLGLKMESRRTAVGVLVVDRVEKPSAD